VPQDLARVARFVCDTCGKSSHGKVEKGKKSHSDSTTR